MVQMLEAADPIASAVDKVVVWGSSDVISRLPDRPWLEARRVVELDGSLARRLLWQTRRLDELAREACDVLFAPAGTYVGRFRPYVAMAQNFLLWDSESADRYSGWARLRLRLLASAQRQSFRRAAQVIFLTEGARSFVLRDARIARSAGTVIPHGRTPAFDRAPRPHLPMSAFSRDRPFRWLYVSTIEPYKNHPSVVRAGAQLRKEGYPIAIDFLGAANPVALGPFQGALREADPAGEWCRYYGAVPWDALPGWHDAAHAFVFASSCETFSLALLDAMTCGLPVACTSHPIMRDVAADCVEWIADSRSAPSIADAMRQLMDLPARRAELASNAQQRARMFSWEGTARATFDVLAATAATRQP